MSIPLFSAANRNMTQYQITVGTCHLRVLLIGIRLPTAIGCSFATHKLRNVIAAHFDLEIVSACLRIPTKGYLARKVIYTDDTHCVEAILHIYRVSQEEGTKLRESVPYVKIYRYNQKHLYPKLNGYGDNGQRSLKL